MFFKDKINPKGGFYSVLAGPMAATIWILLGFEKLSSIYIGLAASLIVLLLINKKTHSADFNGVDSYRGSTTLK